MANVRARRQASRHRIEWLPDDLFDYAQAPERRSGRPVKHDLVGWRVIDDWPERVPVTDREVDVFEAWFGDVLDAMFDPV